MPTPCNISRYPIPIPAHFASSIPRLALGGFDSPLASNLKAQDLPTPNPETRVKAR